MSEQPQGRDSRMTLDNASSCRDGAQVILSYVVASEGRLPVLISLAKIWILECRIEVLSQHLVCKIASMMNLLGCRVEPNKQLLRYAKSRRLRKFRTFNRHMCNYKYAESIVRDFIDHSRYNKIPGNVLKIYEFLTDALPSTRFSDWVIDELDNIRDWRRRDQFYRLLERYVDPDELLGVLKDAFDASGRCATSGKYTEVCQCPVHAKRARDIRL